MPPPAAQRPLARRAGGAAALLLAAGLLGAAARLAQLWATRPGFRRVVRFWQITGHIALRYFLATKFAKKGPEMEARVEKVHAWSAPRMRRVAEELGGIYVKVLQVMRLVPGFLPDAWKRELITLHNGVQATDWEQIKQVIERDLGAPVSGLFESVEREPLGAASLGQAHLATWRGRRVVLKVQYPNAAANLRADFDCFETLLGLFNGPEEMTMLQDTRRQFEKELDYQQEARHLKSLRESLAAVPEFAGRVAVPELIPELTRGRVLGMEFLPGASLESSLLRRQEMLGIKRQKDSTLLHKIEASSSPTRDSLPPGAEAAAVRRPRSQRLALALSGLLGLDRSLRLAGLVAEVRLRFMRCRGRAGKGTKELRAILRLLLDLQAYQIFFSPHVNGDPHPGNVLLLPDGRIGLIDLGQCVQLPKDVKAFFAHAMIVLSEPESPEADARLVRLCEKIDVRTARGDAEFLVFCIRSNYNRLKAEWLANNNKHYKDMASRDRLTRHSIELFMLGRGASLLRGVCFALQENISIAEAYRPWAERWLQENPGWKNFG